MPITSTTAEFTFSTYAPDLYRHALWLDKLEDEHRSSDAVTANIYREYSDLDDVVRFLAGKLGKRITPRYSRWDLAKEVSELLDKLEADASV